MGGEALGICREIINVTDALNLSGIDLTHEILGITSYGGQPGAFGCLENHVRNLYGNDLPTPFPPELEFLGRCPSGQAAQEDWANATAIVAAEYDWRPGAIRVIVPLSDEGPHCGRLDLDALDTIAMEYVSI